MMGDLRKDASSMNPATLLGMIGGANSANPFSNVLSGEGQNILHDPKTRRQLSHTALKSAAPPVDPALSSYIGRLTGGAMSLDQIVSRSSQNTQKHVWLPFAACVTGGTYTLELPFVDSTSGTNDEVVERHFKEEISFDVLPGNPEGKSYTLLSRGDNIRDGVTGKEKREDLTIITHLMEGGPDDVYEIVPGESADLAVRLPIGLANIYQFQAIIPNNPRTGGELIVTYDCTRFNSRPCTELGSFIVPGAGWPVYAKNDKGEQTDTIEGYGNLHVYPTITGLPDFGTAEHTALVDSLVAASQAPIAVSDVITHEANHSWLAPKPPMVRHTDLGLKSE